jgi:hypothetical protein
LRARKNAGGVVMRAKKTMNQGDAASVPDPMAWATASP